jgi:uncharacterized protein YjbJ (UPF0337 family)
VNEPDVSLPVVANKLWQWGMANRNSPNGMESTVKPSTQDRTEGKLHEVKGKIKEHVGRATNGPDLEVSGKRKRTLAKFKNGSATLKGSSANKVTEIAPTAWRLDHRSAATLSIRKFRKEETWKRRTYDDDNRTKQVCTPAMQVHSASERQILRSSL